MCGDNPSMANSANSKPTPDKARERFGQHPPITLHDEAATCAACNTPLYYGEDDELLTEQGAKHWSVPVYYCANCGVWFHSECTSEGLSLARAARCPTCNAGISGYVWYYCPGCDRFSGQLAAVTSNRDVTSCSTCGRGLWLCPATTIGFAETMTVLTLAGAWLTLFTLLALAAGLEGMGLREAPPLALALLGTGLLGVLPLLPFMPLLVVKGVSLLFGKGTFSVGERVLPIAEAEVFRALPFPTRLLRHYRWILHRLLLARAVTLVLIGVLLLFALLRWGCEG